MNGFVDAIGWKTGYGQDMIRKLLSVTLMLVAMPVWAEPLSLGQMSSYLSGLKSVQARFVQVNPDGSRDNGLLSIKRPGRARFDYEAPNDTLVMAGGGRVAIFDTYSGGQPEEYPLRRTPLNLILGRNVTLQGSEMVVGHKSSGERTLVIAQDPDHPEYGQIGLYFEAAPIRLAEWIITNELGEQTRVVLGPFADRANLPASLFNIVQEKNRRGD